MPATTLRLTGFFPSHDNYGMNRLATRIAPVVLLLALAVRLDGASASAARPADEALKQALQSLARGDLDAAITELDQAIRLDPNEPKYLGMRGVVRLRQGDYARRAADLKAAIKLNTGDAGQAYRPSSGAKLSEAALRHGEQQVAAMLRDRPAMAQHHAESAFLRDWAARKFAGEDLGTPIDWDPSPPLHSDAEHLAPGDGDNAAILVAATYDSGPKQGSPRSFEELWAGAVYELHNVNFAREFVRLNDEADQGKVSKTAFVAGIVKYELRAAQQTRAFYLQVFLPWAEKMKLGTDPALWFCDWWDRPEGVLKSFSDKSAYPWRPYARTHDWATVRRQWRRGRVLRALGLLQQMRVEKGYAEDEADVHFWLGRCLDRLHRSDEALNEYAESLRHDPQNAEVYRARARLYRKLGQTEKADADLAKAKTLQKST